MTDCLILGGGAIGLSLAYELARLGTRVTLLDRRDFGREASWAGAGILPPAQFTGSNDGFSQLSMLSGKLHPEWAAQLHEETGIDTGYRRCGGVYVARSEASAKELAATVADWRRLGIEHEELSPEALARREPAIAAGERKILKSYFVPDEAQLRNPWHLRALVVACQRQGVNLRAGVECSGMQLRGGRITAVDTSEGAIAAEQICVTAGPWSGQLFGAIGVRLPVKPIRGQIALLKTAAPTMTSVITEGHKYLVPRDDGRVLVGSTEEDVGFDARPTAEGISGLLRFATELAPVLADASLETSWAGLRPASADGLPYMGLVPRFENLYCAAGHYRGGLFLSPATAVVMGRILRGEPAGIEMTSMSPGRVLAS